MTMSRNVNMLKSVLVRHMNKRFGRYDYESKLKKLRCNVKNRNK